MRWQMETALCTVPFLRFWFSVEELCQDQLLACTHYATQINWVWAAGKGQCFTGALDGSKDSELDLHCFQFTPRRPELVAIFHA
jgi:hypothetical protein